MNGKWLTAGRESAPAVTDKKTELAARKSGSESRVQALRKAAGKTECRTIHCICARTSGRFHAVFARETATEKFTVVRIDKDDRLDVAAGLSALASLVRPASSSSFAAAEFDDGGLVCPYCHASDGAVHCGKCNEYTCMGRKRIMADGTVWSGCHDACRAYGPLKQANAVHGSAGSGSGARPALAGKAPPALPRR